MNKKNLISFVSLLSVTLLIVGFVFSVSKTYADQAVYANNSTGWSWAANIGWLKANNCTQITKPIDQSKCPGIGYGVNVLRPVPAAHGLISGYAWSSNLGWISFEPDAVVGYNIAPPSPTYQAYVDWTANSGNGPYPVKGWARACSVFVAGCSGAVRSDDYLGGWDGFIALSDTKSDPYTWNLEVSTNGKSMAGFGWGSNVVGWVDMKMNITDIKYQCSDGIDNDSDGHIDYTTDPVDGHLTGDPGCYGPTDDDESDDPNQPPDITFFTNMCAITAYPRLAWNSTGADECRIISRGIYDYPDTNLDHSIASSLVQGVENLGGVYYYTSKIPFSASDPKYTLECIGNAGTVTRETTTSSCASAGNFTLSAQPPKKSLVTGTGSDSNKQVATFTVSANPKAGFTSPITLAVQSWPSNIPSGTEGGFSAPTLTYNGTSYSTSTFTVKIPTANVVLGTSYNNIIVSGTYAGETHTAPVNLTVAIKPIYIER